MFPRTHDYVSPSGKIIKKILFGKSMDRVDQLIAKKRQEMFAVHSTSLFRAASSKKESHGAAHCYQQCIVPAVAPCVIAPRLVSFDFRYLECLIGASPRSPGSHRRRTSPIRLCLIVFQLVSVLLIVIVSKRGPLDRQLFMIRIQRNSYHRN